MKYCKLTDENNQTHNGTTWGEGITHKATGDGNQLCSSDVIHIYDSPLKAAMFNLAHAGFKSPILWECEVNDIVADDGTKIGCKKCTTIKKIPLPEITTAQRVRFVIYLAREVYSEKLFDRWAENWLYGKDKDRGVGAAAEVAAEAVWIAEAAWAVDVNILGLLKKAIEDETRGDDYEGINERIRLFFLQEE